MKRCRHRDKRRERDETETETESERETKTRDEDKSTALRAPPPESNWSAIYPIGVSTRVTDSRMLSGSWVFVKSPRGDFQPRGCARDERGVLFGRECVEYTERGVLFVGMRETA